MREDSIQLPDADFLGLFPVHPLWFFFDYYCDVAGNWTVNYVKIMIAGLKKKSVKLLNTALFEILVDLGKNKVSILPKGPRPKSSLIFS